MKGNITSSQLNSASSKYVPLRSNRSGTNIVSSSNNEVQNTNRPLTSSTSIVTLDEKIGKVISEIKQLNKQKAERYGIAESIGNSSRTRQVNHCNTTKAAAVKNLADATFNERDDFTALFEKKESSSYENYRNQLMAASCTNLKPQNNLSLNSETNNKAYMTAEDPDRPTINTHNRYEEILIPQGSVMIPGGRTLVDEHFNQSYLQQHSISKP